jgi:hypothetical protein
MISQMISSVKCMKRNKDLEYKLLWKNRLRLLLFRVIPAISMGLIVLHYKYPSLLSNILIPITIFTCLTLSTLLLLFMYQNAVETINTYKNMQYKIDKHLITQKQQLLTTMDIDIK